MSLLAAASVAALLAWLTVFALPSRPWSTRERLEALDAGTGETDLGGVTVVIPARDESASIGRTLSALAQQGRNLHVMVVDDQSRDGTVAICEDAARALAGRLEVAVLEGAPLPDGWGGKLWALEQGLGTVERSHTLLLDADIELAPRLVPALLGKAREDGCAMVSIMAELRCRTFWERLLVPPFIYFFKLIYPFARVSDPASRVAAAAGGCILIETGTLRAVGGFERIRGALIDDCTLAREVKSAGYGVWLGLSHSVRSLREYGSLADFSAMVTRTAFTQLRYSTGLLVLVTLAMLALFVAPLAGILASAWNAGGGVMVSIPYAAENGAIPIGPVSALGVALMCLSYWPTVRFYGLPPAWTLTLPGAAALFLGMTWLSALNYWRGVRARWKGRDYDAD